MLLEHLAEASILQTLKRRYKQDFIYTVSDLSDLKRWQSRLLLYGMLRSRRVLSCALSVFVLSVICFSRTQYIGDVLISVNPFKVC